MSLQTTPFDQISEATLQRLVDNGVPEGRELEYKRDRYGNTDEHKREFLKDVSALANSSGGHLLIGIEESEGVPVALRGITSGDCDAERQRLENLLLDNIEPRLIGVRMREVSLSSGAHVLIIHVPKSWNSGAWH